MATPLEQRCRECRCSHAFLQSSLRFRLEPTKAFAHRFVAMGIACATPIHEEVPGKGCLKLRNRTMPPSLHDPVYMFRPYLL